MHRVFEVHSTIAHTRGVKLTVRGPNPTRHALFCGPHHVSFVLAFGLTELHWLQCCSRLTFFAYSHNVTLRPNNYRLKPGVGNLWLASQMWLFWWRDLACLLFSWHDWYEWNLFCNFASTRLQSHQQHLAAPEVALTIRSSMLLKEKIQTLTIVYNCWFCLKMHTLVCKLVALSVEKYYIALTEIQLKICRFQGSLSQKGSQPLG